MVVISLLHLLHFVRNILSLNFKVVFYIVIFTLLANGEKIWKRLGDAKTVIALFNGSNISATFITPCAEYPFFKF